MRRRALVRHVHASGRFDRSRASLLAALRLYAKKADIITLTEMSTEDRAKAMNDLGGPWFHLRGSGFPAADEVAVMWNRNVWQLVASYSRMLSSKTGSNRLSIAGLTVVLKHVVTGQTILISVAHTPADVEGTYHDRTDAKVQAHVTTNSHWSTHIRSMVNSHPGLSGVLIVADWNLDLHKEWVKAWVVKQWGREVRPSWYADMPHTGSLGHRLIDWTLTNLKVKRVRLLKHNNSSDHTAYYEALVLPRNGAK